MIQKIKTEQTYSLRSLVLRKGLPIETCYFDQDNDACTFHLGYFHDKQIVCIATFVKNSYKSMSHTYQLRGMATSPDFQSKGLGQKILEYGLEELKRLQISQIWCNARVTAIKFYQKNNFSIDSDVFDIETAGPHVKMMRIL